MLGGKLQGVGAFHCAYHDRHAPELPAPRLRQGRRRRTRKGRVRSWTNSSVARTGQQYRIARARARIGLRVLWVDDLRSTKKSMTNLSVNLNKIALLRNARNVGFPSVIDAARVCIEAGAQGITVHPRPDE